MAVQNYKDLIVWQKSMSLAKEIYRLANKLPKEELYGLTNQLKRAAVSIPSNIAEGNGRKSEVETQLLLCVELNYLESADTETALELSTEVGKMLNAMIAKFTV